jgi:DUF4097 and DUF4098 domain-containing protein YvlB
MLIVIVAALATLAPVCVLSGGDTSSKNGSIELSEGALVEVFGENAEVRIRRVSTDTLRWDITLHNGEFVDFYTQSLTDKTVDHYVISATTSTGGATTANSVLELSVPDGIQLVVQSTNRPIAVEEITVISASLTTTNGEISVTNSTGDFELNTNNSEVTVQAVTGQVDITTTNAHVWFEGVVTDGSNSISTTNGDIAVRLGGGSNVQVSGSTHNGDVTVNGGSDSVQKDGDTASFEYSTGDGSAALKISNGPGAIHINPDTIAVFDGDG